VRPSAVATPTLSPSSSKPVTIASATSSIISFWWPASSNTLCKSMR
jgi:hypothetical protein